MGFAEVLLIAVVGLLVVGPERLPGAIRTGSAWLNRFRRGFNDLKRDVQLELHNDEVMRDLRETSEDLRQEAGRWREEVEKEKDRILAEEPAGVELEPGLPSGEGAAGDKGAAVDAKGDSPS